jgi:hypothetical protein
MLLALPNALSALLTTNGWNPANESSDESLGAFRFYFAGVKRVDGRV